MTTLKALLDELDQLVKYSFDPLCMSDKAQLALLRRGARELPSALRGMMEENARMRVALKALNKQLDFSWPYSDTKPWIPMGNPEIEALNAAFSLARAALEQESKDE